MNEKFTLGDIIDGEAEKSGPEKGLDRKLEMIEKQTANKQNSIRESSIMRDSALFAACLKTKEELLEDYKYWREFFNSEYK